jgi:uncharacterized protein YkwD
MIEMTRLLAFSLSLMLALTACTTGSTKLGPDGKPLPRVYRITKAKTAKIQFRMLDSVNALREASELEMVEMSSELNAAAATHSRDMSLQNRPWHFGSDGSSPLDRIARTGYAGNMLGENISETYQNETETLAAWMEQADTREVIMNPDARFMGFSWHQDANGKIWWTQILGS